MASPLLVWTQGSLLGVVWSWSWQMGPGTSQLPRLPITTEMAELLTFYCLQLNCTSSIMFNFDEGLHNDPFSKGIFKL